MTPLIALLAFQGQGQAAPKAIPAARIIARNAPTAAPVVAELTLAPTKLNLAFNREQNLPYYPSGIPLVAAKPVGVVKEPTYVGKPKYGAVRLGDGPRSTVYLVIDETETASKLYLDANANGDLTDDGVPEWGERSERDGVVSYQKDAVLRASWGNAVE